MPDQVELMYWFTEYPQEPIRFVYSSDQYQLDRVYLMELISEIEGLGEGDFQLTADDSKCKYCTYRSLCDRGISAGFVDPMEVTQESEEDFYLDLDFDQIAEIEF
jgi:hypothetical protein